MSTMCWRELHFSQQGARYPLLCLLWVWVSFGHGWSLFDNTMKNQKNNAPYLPEYSMRLCVLATDFIAREIPILTLTQIFGITWWWALSILDGRVWNKRRCYHLPINRSKMLAASYAVHVERLSDSLRAATWTACVPARFRIPFLFTILVMYGEVFKFLVSASR